MRPVSFALLALIGASPATAQTKTQPTILLTIFAGVATGHDLWTVGRQPLLVLGSNPAQYDTIRLSQAIGSTIIAGASATYFPSAHFGLQFELSYLGLPVDGSCTGLFFNPDPDQKNQQTCNDIQTRSPDGGAIAIFTGATFRAASRGAVSPYGRLDLGIVSESRSTIEVSGAFVTANGQEVREVITDTKPSHVAALLGGAIGFTRPISPGYQFRWEVRDLLVPLRRVTGPASPLGIPPTASRLYQHFSLALGFDVVLEKKRGHRY